MNFFFLPVGILHANSQPALRPEVSLSLPDGIGLGFELLFPKNPLPEKIIPEKIAFENGHFSALHYYANISGFFLPLARLEILSFGFAAGLRYFPFKDQYSGFFLNSGLVFHWISFQTKLSFFQVSGQSPINRGILNFNRIYINPGLGWAFILSDTLSLSVELGVELALIAWSSAVLEGSSIGDNLGNSRLLQINQGAVIDRLAALTLPRCTLFRLTWVW